MSQAFAPVVLRPPELVQKAVFDGRRLGLQLHYIDGMGKELSKARACWFALGRLWVCEQDHAEHTLARRPMGRTTPTNTTNKANCSTWSTRWGKWLASNGSRR